MNKTDLAHTVMTATKSTNAEAAEAVNSVLTAIAGALRVGESVALLGFGTFTVRRRNARQVRNPKTGELMEVKASKVVGFKAGKSLKEAVK